MRNAEGTRLAPALLLRGVIMKETPAKKGPSTLLTAALLAAFVTAACLPAEGVTTVQDLDVSGEGGIRPLHLSGLPRDGTTPAVGALVVANDCRIGASVLVEEAGLFARAAESIVAARAGGDGICGTADDLRFGALEDLLDLRYVGPRNVERLVRFAEAIGAEPDYRGGTVDGVSFTDAQAWHSLVAANGASFEALDRDAGLRADAARNIVEARPIVSLEQLRQVYRVGPKTLERLRDWASPRVGTAFVLDEAALARLLPEARARLLEDEAFSWEVRQLADDDGDLYLTILATVTAELERQVGRELHGVAFSREADALGAVVDTAASIKRSVRIDGWSYLGGLGL
jgi:hypothetical protein